MSSITTALDNTYSDALGSAISEASGSSDMDKQAFLMLLVTQLQYQDPLNPMEDTDFVAQLAQFSSLEAQQTSNEYLEEMLTIQQEMTAISAANYIGKEVSARGYGISVTDGQASTVQFAAAETMSKCTVNILDSSTSTIIATVDLGELAASIHDFTWDGKKNDGSTAADGVYTVAFVGYNSAGERVLVDTSVTGLVNGVSYYNGETYLRMADGRTVTIGNVREVLLPTDSSADSTDSTDESSDSSDSEDSEDETEDSELTVTDELLAELDQLATNAQSALEAWNNARDSIASLLGSSSGT